MKITDIKFVGKRVNMFKKTKGQYEFEVFPEERTFFTTDGVNWGSGFCEVSKEDGWWVSLALYSKYFKEGKYDSLADLLVGEPYADTFNFHLVYEAAL